MSDVSCAAARKSSRRQMLCRSSSSAMSYIVQPSGMITVWTKIWPLAIFQNTSREFSGRSNEIFARLHRRSKVPSLNIRNASRLRITPS